MLLKVKMGICRTVQMDVFNELERREITNVLGVFRGHLEPGATNSLCLSGSGERLLVLWVLNCYHNILSSISSSLIRQFAKSTS